MSHGGLVLHDVLGEAGGADGDVLATFAAGERLTRGELRERAAGVAAGLAGLGVGPGDRVAVLLGNRSEYLETFFAASMLGAAVCHLHTASMGHMLERALRLTEPACRVIDHEAAGRLDGLELASQPRLVAVGGAAPAGGSGFEELRAGGGEAPAGAAVSPLDPVCIYSSSGTTGPAKGVTLSHAALFEMTRTAQIVMGLRASDVAYTITPFYHANALVFMFLATCLSGGETVFAERFSASGFWEDVRRFGATRTSLVGSATALLLGREPAVGDADNPLELAAAVPRPKEAASFEARFGVRLTEFYGSTEANLPIGVPSELPAEVCPERSCGRVLPGWECRIAGPDGAELPAGEDGQLLVRPGRPGVVSSGYWGEPERTVELWQDLWIHTGDLMRHDEDGWFFYVDRLKDAIRVSGENVASADVEHVVAEFPGVAEAAAYGVTSELGEQDIMVAVVMERGSVDGAELRAHCEQRLPYYAVPRYFVGDESLPRTPTERVRKVVLRERGVTAATVDLGRPRRPR